MNPVLLGIIAFAVIFILYVMFKYNRFVTLKNRATEAWSDVLIQLKRRYDLVPNLISTVKGYAAHEASTFENVTKARNNAMQADANSPEAKAAQENQLSGALLNLFAVSERYPDLKANQNFLHLQAELVDIEDKIKAARRFYNANVRTNNIAIEQFPGNMIAGIFSFKAFTYFEIDDAELEIVKNAPTVSF